MHTASADVTVACPTKTGPDRMIPPGRKQEARDEVTKQTYYRWREEYGGMEVSQAKRLSPPYS